METETPKQRNGPESELGPASPNGRTLRKRENLPFLLSILGRMECALEAMNVAQELTNCVD